MKALLTALILTVPTAAAAIAPEARTITETYFLRTAELRRGMDLESEPTPAEASKALGGGIGIAASSYNDQLEVALNDPTNEAELRALVLMAQSAYRRASLHFDMFRGVVLIESQNDTRPGAAAQHAADLAQMAMTVALFEANLAQAEALLANLLVAKQQAGK